MWRIHAASYLFLASFATMIHFSKRLWWRNTEASLVTTEAHDPVPWTQRPRSWPLLCRWPVPQDRSLGRGEGAAGAAVGARAAHRQVRLHRAAGGGRDARAAQRARPHHSRRDHLPAGVHHPVSQKTDNRHWDTATPRTFTTAQTWSGEFAPWSSFIALY